MMGKNRYLSSSVLNNCLFCRHLITLLLKYDLQTIDTQDKVTMKKNSYIHLR